MNVSLDDIYLFTQTVVHGGISAAAEANQLQRSKVSRRLQELEKALGVQLLIRTTRSIELTAHGKRLFELVGQSVDHIQQGLIAMHEYQQELSGKVRLAIPSALMSSAAFSAIISEYTQRYPDISVEIENHQESVDLKRQSFDLQLLPSVVKVTDDSYIQFSLLPYTSHFVASKAYLEAHPPIESLDDLKHHRLLTNRYNANLLDPALDVALKSDDLNLLRSMAIAGNGIAFIPQTHSKPSLQDGLLVEVLPEIAHPKQHLTLIYPSALFLPNKVVALIELFREKFK
ncbi:LysR family transcriptional regulator [Vibrio natriegens]|uniref:LysR family transcriptional regulator n=1 Tax=Vibrio natriegens NBRC 15636 = ATCC 14048 = DSM 759 TaxID=1219067 RepID=A0AAN0Y2P5_VIBNA|nr:LysR family transcriptional regulator [Vibrio natriegens]ALR15146.1 LysR family transcriptional regulator [Vibrio natriegens NBRC 15636 = ATCC 14048 = DSM 759]ANQ12988.1 LysR family transcriptional regulator [Vibrio natriegens NBRC 15636 = ATCC 14048 = DSM 759]EPM39427.1 LysR family transcriptional regulator [Vibrio natriegens NBRC 15636 = ATCC 14048 = DSM 759]MCG9699291.1 LysR family transcriptional regulator [Vibrio natriegens]MDX6027407.1 LysR family transcriptional regulator [Vibrio nat